MAGDEPMIFRETPPPPAPTGVPWDILVADDDEGVHDLTRIVFRNFTFEGRPVRLHDVYTGESALEFLAGRPDVAVVLLDVVMELPDSGLTVVRKLREELQNSLTRIILRTGQPGFAPEEQIIVEYDINDYKEKSELTRQKLLTSVVTALRSYRDLVQIQHGRSELRKLVQATAGVFQLRTLGDFCRAVLDQLVYLFHMGEPAGPSNGFAATFQDGNFVVRAGVGSFSDRVGCAVLEAASPGLFPEILGVLEARTGRYRAPWFIAYFEAGTRLRTVVCIQSDQPVDPGVLDLVRIFNFDVSLGLNNLFLNQEVTETQKELVFNLGELVESRSREPSYHVRRVSGIAAVLFQELGYPPGVIDSLALAAAMHDIGKIGIPDRILTKPDLLDDEEFAVMKTHTTIGYNLLKASPLPVFRMAAEIALNHHERWDGQGYPRGLAGELIPLAARVTSVAEVFDALTSRRDYHHPWDDEAAFDYLRSGSGKSFDPAVVKLFFEVRDKVLRVRDDCPYPVSQS